jgi:Na+-transporting NADH:ubiquinone oxidoreductase subunit NqrB
MGMFESKINRLLKKEIFADARHFQILALGSLLTLLLFWSAFAPPLHVVAMIVISTLGTQFLFFKLLKIPSNDFRSPLITSLSLCLLFKTNLIWLYPLAGMAAMASKFLLRFNNKHLFNPANFAIVIGLLLLPHNVWVSPGQWGSIVWLVFGLICLAILVLSKAGRADMSVFFLGFWALLLFGRALWLGDPLAIPTHNIQSGALLIFAFFMISDPMTTPDHRLGRMVFALITAILAFTMQYGFQIREAVFYALFIVCMITPVLDYCFKNKRYQWRKA